jgi:hypothetical protein
MYDCFLALLRERIEERELVDSKKRPTARLAFLFVTSRSLDIFVLSIGRG